MLSEHELLPSSDDVFLVFRVFVVQVLNEFGFYQTLFVKSLLILQYFKCYVLSFFVVITLEDHTEATFSKFLINFVSVSEMLFEA